MAGPRDDVGQGETMPPRGPDELEELTGENTRIDDMRMLAEQSTAILEEAPTRPVLVVEQGEDQGREFALQDGVNGVGRGVDNDVILADVSVSRRHLRVSFEDGLLSLRDLGSGNGTTVNGRRVAHIALADGDRIAIGETTLVVRLPPALSAIAADTSDHDLSPGFVPSPGAPSAGEVPATPGYTPEVTPSEVAGPPPSGGQSRGLLLPIAIGSGAALLLAVGVALGAMLGGGGSEPPTVASPAADDAALARGRAALEEGRWDYAERVFTEVIQRRGSNAEAASGLARVRRAREHARLLDEGRTALDRGDSTTALSRAGSVPSDSPVAAEAAALAAQARGRQVADHVSAGRVALAAGDREAARVALERARNVDPSSPVVRAFATALGEGDRDQPVEATTPVAPVSVRVRPPGPRPRRVEQPSTEAVDTGAVLSAYRAGRFVEASAEARRLAAAGTDAARMEALAGRIDRFADLYARSERASFGAVVRLTMEQAFRLDAQIGASPHRQRLGRAIADAYLDTARRTERLPRMSCANVRTALRYDSAHPEGRRMMGGCETHARGMLEEAEGASAERATEIYQTVVEMVPPESATAADANRRLGRLRRQSSHDEDE